MSKFEREVKIMLNTKMYITHEDPFKGRTFTSVQMHEVYRDLANKKEYPDFTDWLIDMLRSGVFEKL